MVAYVAECRGKAEVRVGSPAFLRDLGTDRVPVREGVVDVWWTVGGRVVQGLGSARQAFAIQRSGQAKRPAFAVR